MAKVTSLSEGVMVSISQLAAEFSMTRETVAKRIADAHVVPALERRGYPVYRLKDVINAIMGTGGDVDPQRLDPYRRQAHYRAELDRLKLEMETREVIPRIEVEQEQARILRIVGHGYDVLPDILERDCGCTPEMLARVERLCDEKREQVYQELIDDEDGDARASA